MESDIMMIFCKAITFPLASPSAALSSAGRLAEAGAPLTAGAAAGVAAGAAGTLAAFGLTSAPEAAAVALGAVADSGGAALVSISCAVSMLAAVFQTLNDSVSAKILAQRPLAALLHCARLDKLDNRLAILQCAVILICRRTSQCAATGPDSSSCSESRICQTEQTKFGCKNPLMRFTYSVDCDTSDTDL